MALRPGRQRSSATPIIAKVLPYPLQNRRASKSATHGFASKLDTRHKNPYTQVYGFFTFSLFTFHFSLNRRVRIFWKVISNSEKVRNLFGYYKKCYFLIAQNPPCTASIFVPTVKQPTGGTFFIPHSLTESDTSAYTENSQDYRLARDKPKGVLFHVFRKQ